MADTRPSAPVRSDTEYSSDMGPEPEPEQSLRSRSQSRRRRRQKQQKTQQRPSAEAGALTAVQEEPGQQAGQAQAQAQAQAPAPQQNGFFEHIGGDETSMDGPVTYARAMRGEIPLREGMPQNAVSTAKQSEEKDPMDQDGLKLRLELNIDIEIELKASLRGDLTLSLYA